MERARARVSPGVPGPRTRRARVAAVVLVLCAAAGSCRVAEVGEAVGNATPPLPTRDPWQHPFPWDSIWNVPIGDAVAFAVEWGDRGRVVDEFAAAWGFPLDDARRIGCTDGSTRCAFLADLGDLLAALVVVDDNAPDRIGGAGARRAPCAGPFPNGSGGAPPSCGTVGVAAR